MMIESDNVFWLKLTSRESASDPTERPALSVDHWLSIVGFRPAKSVVEATVLFEKLDVNF